jgi:hemoglobin
VTLRGSSADPDVGHRCLLDLAPGLRPPEDATVFERIGGQATVDRLVDSLYDRFASDAVIRPFFGRALANGRDRQKRFFGEWLGGPPRYSESAWGALYQHHEDLPITMAVAERWLDHLRGALSDTVPAEGDAAGILERARAVALLLANSEHEPAGRRPGSSMHRSQQIASCGIGARTMKQAVLLANGARWASWQRSSPTSPTSSSAPRSRLGCSRARRSRAGPRWSSGSSTTGWTRTRRGLCTPA